MNEGLGALFSWFFTTVTGGRGCYFRWTVSTYAKDSARTRPSVSLQSTSSENGLESCGFGIRVPPASLRAPIRPLPLACTAQWQRRALWDLLFILRSCRHDYAKRKPRYPSCARPLCLGHSVIPSSTEHLLSDRHCAGVWNVAANMTVSPCRRRTSFLWDVVKCDGGDGALVSNAEYNELKTN